MKINCPCCGAPLVIAVVVGRETEGVEVAIAHRCPTKPTPSILKDDPGCVIKAEDAPRG